MTKKVEVITFGCRLNTYESEVMRNHAKDAGLDNTIIVNTCAVTSEAERQARQSIRKLRKENPNYLLVGALGGAALIGLIPGLGDAAAASIRKGARSALDTSKRMIPTKKVDDAYNPVIGFGGEDSYDPIVEKYLTPVKPTEKSADEKFALELLKKLLPILLDIFLSSIIPALSSDKLSSLSEQSMPLDSTPLILAIFNFIFDLGIVAPGGA